MVAKDRRYLNSLFFKLWTIVFKKIASANFMVSSRVVLVKSEWISKLPTKLMESCSAILVEKLNVTWGVVHKFQFQFGLCNKSLHKKIVRRGEHVDISTLTNERVQTRKDSAVCYHL